MRFFHDQIAYDFDGEAAHTQDQDILLPDGRILIVGYWQPVKKFFYSDEIACYRPTGLRERRNTLPLQAPFEEAARTANLALAQLATFTPANTVFRPATWYYAQHNEVEKLIQETFGRSDYAIAEGWENGSYHSYSLDEQAIAWHEKWDQKELYAYLELNGHAPNLQWFLCECVVRGVLQPGEYLIHCSW